MNFDKHELKLLAASGTLAAPGQPVKLAWLSGLFSRPGKLRETVDKLRIGQFIMFDPYQSELRVLAKSVLEVLNEFNQTPELFTTERPLDAVLAEQSLIGRLSDASLPLTPHPDPLPAGRGEVEDGRTGRASLPVSKDTETCKMTRGETRPMARQGFAPRPEPEPPDPPGPIENPSVLCGSLRSNFAETSADFAGDAAPSRALKVFKNHKGIKPLQDFMALKEALLSVESGPEEQAYQAMRSIVGHEVFEGGDVDPRTRQVRLGDGGKWRNRWRTNRGKTFSVMASLVELIKEGRVKSRGGRVEALWQEIFKLERELK